MPDKNVVLTADDIFLWKSRIFGSFIGLTCHFSVKRKFTRNFNSHYFMRKNLSKFKFNTDEFSLIFVKKNVLICFTLWLQFPFFMVPDKPAGVRE
jgi:hypothetical protein